MPDKTVVFFPVGSKFLPPLFRAMAEILQAPMPARCLAWTLEVGKVILIGIKPETSAYTIQPPSEIGLMAYEQVRTVRVESIRIEPRDRTQWAQVWK